MSDRKYHNQGYGQFMCMLFIYIIFKQCIFKWVREWMCVSKMNRKKLCFKPGNKLNWEKIGYGFQKSNSHLMFMPLKIILLHLKHKPLSQPKIKRKCRRIRAWSSLDISLSASLSKKSLICVCCIITTIWSLIDKIRIYS